MNCKVCTGMEPRTVDRLLLSGHGIRFIASRFGVTRKDVTGHRDGCLQGERREAVEASLRSMIRGEG